ncbi:MAG: hypothetical protein CFE24_10215 [Flavobacterium sp. BFFFF2]|nr:MAG: hypothetical protein CFE24_10215 [Flavobacterium sp. BFFFF2]
MMKPFLFFVLMLCCHSCTQKKAAQTVSTDVNEKEMYSVINIVLHDLQPDEMAEGNQTPYLADQLSEPEFVSANPYLMPKIDSLLGGDVHFMQSQVKKWKGFILNQKRIKYKTLISAKKLDQMLDFKAADRAATFFRNYQQAFGDKRFIRISMPIFSRDKKRFYIDISRVGSGCGYVYIKKKSGWVHYSLGMWVS